MTHKQGGGWRSRAGRFVWGFFRIYLVLLLLLMFFENALVYPAKKYPAGEWTTPHAHEDVYFDSADGTKLHGWLFRHPQPRAVVLYHHGNGEHVADNADRLHALRERYALTIFAYDYRGYGRSEGRAHEAGVLADSRAAQRWLADHLQIAPQEIVIHGRSLGGALAVECAAANGCRGLIIESSFSSLPAAAAAHYPFFPVRWVMRNRLDSASKIGEFSGPLLQVHGVLDAVVPLDIGRQLFDAAKNASKTFVTLENRDHNNVQLADFADSLDTFYEQLK